MRKFALCRLCFRKLALEGDVAGRDEEQLVGPWGAGAAGAVMGRPPRGGELRELRAESYD
jgi:hypothetical protein